MPNNFLSILDKYRKISFSEKDKGERFERLIKAYLLTDPKYSNLFKKVWMWNEFPSRADLGSSDTGIDLVGLTNDGDYWAIQCKCYSEPVGIKAIQEAYAGRDFYDCMVGVVLTNQYFTAPAVEVAKKLKILLWDRGYIDRMLEE